MAFSSEYPCGDHERRISNLEEWQKGHDKWAGERDVRLSLQEEKMRAVVEALREFKESTTWQNRFVIATFVAVIGYFASHAMGWIK